MELLVLKRKDVADVRNRRGDVNAAQLLDCLPLPQGDATEDPAQVVRPHEAGVALERGLRAAWPHEDVVGGPEVARDGAVDLERTRFRGRRKQNEADRSHEDREAEDKHAVSTKAKLAPDETLHRPALA